MLLLHSSGQVSNLKWLLVKNYDSIKPEIVIANLQKGSWFADVDCSQPTKKLS